MRITIVNQYYPPDLSPTARLAGCLAEHRAALGDEVTVVTGSGGYAGTDVRCGREVRGGVSVIRVAAPGRRVSGVAGRAIQWASFYLLGGLKLVRLPRQDVVICMTTPPFCALLGLLHRRRHGGTRLVQWTMDCYPEILEVTGMIRPGGIAARLLRAIGRRALRGLDHVICLDEAMRDLLRSQAPCGPAFSVIPNFEPRDRFPFPQRPARWEGLDRLGLNGRFVVLYSGNAGWGHEFETVLDAAAELRDDPVSFLFVGGGVKHVSLRDAVSARGLGHVHLHPYVPHEEVPSVLASAGLALVTLSDRALGVMSPAKLYPYLATGLPVLYVGPPGSNVAEAIDRFGCGIRVDHGDAPGFAGAVRRAMADRAWLADLGRRARRAFDEAYCDAVTLPRIDRVIESLGEADRLRGDRRAAA